MSWTMHYGYLNDSDILDTTIFVKENERSYLAVALFSGKSKSFYKKDAKKLLNRISNPKNLTKDWVGSFINPADKASSDFMSRMFDQNNHTREIKQFLEGRIND